MTIPDALAVLADAQQHLSRLLLAEERDVQAIAQQADDVRQADALRFHPACPFRLKDGSTVKLPAMVAVMVDIVTNEPCGIHRTALKPDGSGKAEMPDGSSPKKMLGRAKGAVMKLTVERLFQQPARAGWTGRRQGAPPNPALPHEGGGNDGAYTRAMIRDGPPVAPSIVGPPTTIVAPDAGTSARLATHSRPQRPAGSHE
jgi:hypothetical protein